jgi:hypothetical protein
MEMIALAAGDSLVKPDSLIKVCVLMTVSFILFIAFDTLVALRTRPSTMGAMGLLSDLGVGLEGSVLVSAGSILASIFKGWVTVLVVLETTVVVDGCKSSESFTALSDFFRGSAWSFVSFLVEASAVLLLLMLLLPPLLLLLLLLLLPLLPAFFPFASFTSLLFPALSKFPSTLLLIVLFLLLTLLLLFLLVTGLSLLSFATFLLPALLLLLFL